MVHKVQKEQNKKFQKSYIFSIIFLIKYLSYVQIFNVWGNAVATHAPIRRYKSILREKTKVTLEDAIFRNEKSFKIGNLAVANHYSFWEEEILKDHPQKLINYYSWMVARSQN